LANVSAKRSSYSPTALPVHRLVYPIINMETPMDISFHIHPIETGTTLKQLRKS